MFVSCDWPGRMFTVGLVCGPMLHFWYKYLDWFLPLANASTVAKKVVLDVGINSPVYLAYFFVGEDSCSCH